MKLYFSPGACSLADHIALVESGLPFEAEKVDLKVKTTQSGADYKSINVKGYVPALALDNGDILTENIAILSYIGQASNSLIPLDGIAHFRALEALAYISTELHKNFKPFFAPGSSDEDKAAAGEMLTKRFALFEDQLAHHDFVLGDTFSVADCYLFVMLGWAKDKIGLDVPPMLTAYFNRIACRDAVKQALREEENA